MKSQIRLLSALLALLVVSSLSAWSYPTLFGDSGLVLIPTADTMKAETADLGINYTQFSTDGDQATAVPVRLNYGIVPGAEIFAFFADADQDTAYDALGGGAKISLTSENTERWIPGLALGARLIRLEGAVDQDIVDAYLVGSTSVFRFGDLEENGYTVRAHGGVDFLNFSGDNGDSFFSYFAGMSYEGVNGSSAVIDYVPQVKENGVEFRRSTVSGALRFPLSDIFTLELGATRPFAIGDSSVYLGIGYHIGDQHAEGWRDPTILY